jgi:hypothetical protein
VPMNLAKRACLLILAFVFLTTIGCKSTGEHIRWYDGPTMSADKIALLKVQRDVGFWSPGAILTVDKIDGRPLVTNQLTSNIASEVELLPGSHDLYVSYFDGNNRSIVDAQISFLANAGHVYELHGAQVERSFGKELLQSLFFQHWYWTCWIVDAKTKKIVAGKPRETPLHWYE